MKQMNFNIKLLIGLLFVAYLFTACYNLESEPLQWNSEDRVLNPGDSTENSAIKQLFQACYLDLPLLHTRLQSTYLDAATDDGIPTMNQSGSGDLNNYRNGMVSASNIANLDGDAWTRNYRGIRRVNLFLEKLPIFPPSTQVPESRMVKMKAEARVLRAYYYFELMKRWGGIPLVGDQVFGATDNINIPRSTIAEVAEYIKGEISPDLNKYPNSCFNDLGPAQSSAVNNPTEIGHMNQGVALALLSRLNLYLASPLYNPNNDLNKWKEAAEAAKELIDLGVYDLFRAPTAATLFKQYAMNNEDFPHPEMIMIKQMGSNSSIEQTNSPTGYSYGLGSGSLALVECKGRTSPSQNLVDAFLTSEGKSIFIDYDPEKGIDPASKYNPQDPYRNRDTRLAQTVFLNGSNWLKRPVETFDGGRDRGAIPGAVYTQTGYYLKKFLGNNENSESFIAYNHHYQIFRYAEILLNYAEAMNEYDPTNDEEIIRGIVELRSRARIRPGADGRYGLPAQGEYTQELMRRIIRNERRIEMAFEDQRFWDIRRWKIAAAGDGDAVMTKPVKGIRITKNEDGKYSYEVEDVRQSTFAPHMYWYPIPRNEMLGNNMLEQNPGWSF